jgi:hypothetical protein
VLAAIVLTLAAAVQGETTCLPSAGGNSPVAPGRPLSLTASGPPKATYQWTGPAGFTSSLQNPSLPKVTLRNAGIYTVTATVKDCEASATVAVAVSAGDFDGDGRVDIVWHDEKKTGNVAVWNMEGTVRRTSTLTDPPALPDLHWEIQGEGDFDGDGKPDLLWRDQVKTGELSVWLMDGVRRIRAVPLSPSSFADLGWRIVGTGDFNGDGKTDIVWRDQAASGHIAVWFMDGLVRTSSEPVTPSPFADLHWQIQGVGDFNNDGKPDLVWRDQGATGQVAVWFMDGLARTSSLKVGSNMYPGPAWEIQGVGDFDNDGRPDLLWRDQGITGNIAVWYMDGTTRTSATLLTPSPFANLDWRIVGPR